MDLRQRAMTKLELLDLIARDRASFDAILARVPADLVAEPDLPGGWSVKDVLWHVAWGEREALGAARARALTGSDLWSLTEDERNAAVVAEGRTHSLEEVEREYRESYRALIAELQAMTDDELNDPGRMRGLVEAVPGWPPWRILYDPGHYADHGGTIERWLEGH